MHSISSHITTILWQKYHDNNFINTMVLIDSRIEVVYLELLEKTAIKPPQKRYEIMLNPHTLVLMPKKALWGQRWLNHFLGICLHPEPPSLSEVIPSTAPNHVFLYLALPDAALSRMQCKIGAGTRLGSCVLEVRKKSLLCIQTDVACLAVDGPFQSSVEKLKLQRTFRPHLNTRCMILWYDSGQLRH